MDTTAHRKDCHWIFRLRTPAATFLLAGVFLSAFLLRFTAGMAQRLHYWDTGNRDYLMIAENLAERGEYSVYPGLPTNWRGPLYPFYLAGLFKLFGYNIPVFIAAHAFLGSLIVLATALCAWRAFHNRAIAIVTSIFVGFHPYIIQQSIFIFETSLISLLILLFVDSSIKTSQSWDSRWPIFSGFWLGLAILTKSATLALIPALLVFWFFSLPRDSKKDATIFIFFLAAGITVLPWLVRNMVTNDRPTLIESSAGNNLWKGNNPLTFSIYPEHTLDSLDEYIVTHTPPDKTSENASSQWLRQEALAYIKAHPISFAKKLITNSLLLFHWRLVPYQEGRAVVDANTGAVLSPGLERPLLKQLAFSVLYLVEMPLVWLGFFSLWREHRQAVLFFHLLIGSWTAIHAVAFTYTRFRLPLEPFLQTWAAAGLLWIAVRIWPHLNPKS